MTVSVAAPSVFELGAAKIETWELCMDFVGDEDATRYALEKAIVEHWEDTEAAGVGLCTLPSARIARVFIDELAARGWKLEKKDPRER